MSSTFPTCSNGFIVASYTLHFYPKLSRNPNGNDLRDGLSTSVITGDNLWLCCDDRTTLERLRRTGPHTFGHHCSYCFTDFLDLPDKATEEIDLEGMSEAENYFWVLGSHSIKRKNAKPEKTNLAKQIKRLSQLEVAPNRCLLARVPLVRNPESGDYELRKTVPHPTAADQLERLFYVPHKPHLDRAEGMALLTPHEMLVVFGRHPPASPAPT